MRVPLSFLPWVLAGLVAVTVCAQPTVPTADRFSYLGVGDGLSQSTVTAIVQDRDGFMWFGTNDGLNRYDGVSFTVFRHVSGDVTSLASSRVLDLLEDRHGVLWVATQGGVQWLDRPTGTFHMAWGGPGVGSPCGIIASSLLEGTDGALWTGALTGQLCRRSSASEPFRRVPRAPSTPQANPQGIQSLLLASDGSVWTRGAPVACRVAPGGDTCEPAPATPDKTYPLYAGRRLGMVGTADAGSSVASRLVRRRDGVWETLLTANATRVSAGTQVADRVGEYLWIGTESSGVLVVDVATGESSSLLPDQSASSGLRDATVGVVYRDRQGAVWLGTSDGVSRWDGRAERFELFRSRPGGLSSDRVNGMLVARDGAVWVATNNGLNRLDPETGAVRVFRRPRSADSAHPNAFWRVWEDPDGRMVIGSRRDGLFVLDQASGQFRRDVVLTALLGQLANRPETAAVRYVGGDPDGRIWVGAEQGVAMLAPDGEVQVYRSRTPRLPAHRVNVVHTDRQGDVWLGTDAGLCRRDAEADRFDCFSRRDGLDSDVIWTIAESPATPYVLWIGTIGGGLCRLRQSDDAISCIAASDGLPSDVIYGILPDASGALWLTTTSGLVRYDPTARTIRRYTEADGLQGDEFDLMAFAQGEDGWMVVGGRGGLNRFHPARLRQRTSAPPVHITAVRVLGQPRPGLPSDTLHIRHDDTLFSLDFAALDYADPSNNRYRYRLAGFDEDWRTTDGRRPTASYTRVPPGRYVFEVVGSNHDGVFSDTPDRIEITVHPAWWQRLWVRVTFWLGLLAVAACALAWTVRQRLRRAAEGQAEQLELRRRLAESRERERYRIARELHDGPVQGLYRLGHQLDRATLRRDSDAVLAAREQVNDVADELRDVLRALRPPVIEHLGVGPAVASLGRALGRARPDIRVEIRASADGRGWPLDVQHGLYRVAQEALSNAEKHASPSRIALHLHEIDGVAELTITDDGRGFELPDRLLDLAQADHFGLVGLVERVESLRGTLRVNSQSGTGTTVTARVPVTDDPGTLPQSGPR